MQMTASIFTDPMMRSQLEAYYENKKASLYEIWKARETEASKDVTMRDPDGTLKTMTFKPVSADKMLNAMVSFDKWLEFQAESFDARGPKSLEHAQQRVAQLEAESPESSSNVLATFSSKGTLLAYINADGSLVTSNGAEAYLGGITERADAMGLTGRARVAYMKAEVGQVLAERYSGLKVAIYDVETSPTKREFGKMWYPNHDVDAIYNDAMVSAREHLDSMMAWYQQWQSGMNEIRSFLLSMQEVPAV